MYQDIPLSSTQAIVPISPEKRVPCEPEQQHGFVLRSVWDQRFCFARLGTGPSTQWDRQALKVQISVCSSPGSFAAASSDPYLSASGLRTEAVAGASSCLVMKSGPAVPEYVVQGMADAKVSIVLAPLPELLDGNPGPLPPGAAQSDAITVGEAKMKAKVKAGAAMKRPAAATPSMPVARRRPSAKNQDHEFIHLLYFPPRYYRIFEDVLDRIMLRRVQTYPGPALLHLDFVFGRTSR